MVDWVFHKATSDDPTTHYWKELLVSVLADHLQILFSFSPNCGLALISPPWKICPFVLSVALSISAHQHHECLPHSPGPQVSRAVLVWFPVCAADCTPPSHFWTTVYLQKHLNDDVIQYLVQTDKR